MSYLDTIITTTISVTTITMIIATAFLLSISAQNNICNTTEYKTNFFPQQDKGIRAKSLYTQSVPHEASPVVCLANKLNENSRAQLGEVMCVKYVMDFKQFR